MVYAGGAITQIEAVRSDTTLTMTSSTAAATYDIYKGNDIVTYDNLYNSELLLRNNNDDIDNALNMFYTRVIQSWGERHAFKNAMPRKKLPLL